MGEAASAFRTSKYLKFWAAIRSWKACYHHWLRKKDILTLCLKVNQDMADLNHGQAHSSLESCCQVMGFDYICPDFCCDKGEIVRCDKFRPASTSFFIMVRDIQCICLCQRQFKAEIGCKWIGGFVPVSARNWYTYSPIFLMNLTIAFCELQYVVCSMHAHLRYCLMVLRRQY